MKKTNFSFTNLAQGRGTSLHGGTLKKKFFTQYKEMQNGAVAKKYMTNGIPLFG